MFAEFAGVINRQLPDYGWIQRGWCHHAYSATITRTNCVEDRQTDHRMHKARKRAVFPPSDAPMPSYATLSNTLPAVLGLGYTLTTSLADRPMISDLDIWRAANLLVQRHGADAEIEAAKRADQMIERDDLDGNAVWKRIRRAIIALQAPAEGPPH
jgi:hypothetical protein